MVSIAFVTARGLSRVTTRRIVSTLSILLLRIFVISVI